MAKMATMEPMVLQAIPDQVVQVVILVEMAAMEAMEEMEPMVLTEPMQQMEPLDMMQPLNSTKRDVFNTYYNEELKSRVKSLYARDFDHFGYCFERNEASTSPI